MKTAIRPGDLGARQDALFRLANGLPERALQLRLLLQRAALRGETPATDATDLALVACLDALDALVAAATELEGASAATTGPALRCLPGGGA